MKEEHSTRAAMRQPLQIQPTGEAAATTTVTVEWVYTVQTGASQPTQTCTSGADP